MNLSEFKNWRSLDSVALRDIPEHGQVVYIFRKSDTKEVLYIGSTKNLRQRLFRNFIGGVGGGTTQRIHALLFKEGAIKDTEIAWRQSLDLTSEEKHLLQAYFEQQGQLPIWNKRF